MNKQYEVRQTRDNRWAIYIKGTTIKVAVFLPSASITDARNITAILEAGQAAEPEETR